MAEQWYCRMNGQQYGPGSFAQIKKLADTGRLKPNDFIRPASQTQWTPASKVPALWAPAPRMATSLESPAPAPAKPAAPKRAAPAAPARAAPAMPAPRAIPTPRPAPAAAAPRPPAPRPALNLSAADVVEASVVEAELAPVSPAAAAFPVFGQFSESPFAAAPAGPARSAVSRRKPAAKKTNYGLIAALVTVPIVLLASVGPALRLASQSGGFLSVEEFLKRDAEFTNKMLPKQLDGGVRFDSMTAGPGRQVTFYYTLTNVEQVDPSVDVNQQTRAIKANMLRELRRTPIASYYRRNEVELHFKYRDNHQRPITTINIKSGEF